MNMTKIIAGAIILATILSIVYPFNPESNAIPVEPHYHVTYLLTITYRHEVAAYVNEKPCLIARDFIENRNRDTIPDKATRIVECEIVFSEPLDR